MVTIKAMTLGARRMQLTTCQITIITQLGKPSRVSGWAGARSCSAYRVTYRWKPLTRFARGIPENR